jgi:hypothetical protein
MEAAPLIIPATSPTVIPRCRTCNRFMFIFCLPDVFHSGVDIFAGLGKYDRRGENLSRPVAGVLVTESAVLGVYVKRLKREKKRGAGSSS